MNFFSFAQEKDSLKEKRIIQNLISGITVLPYDQYSVDENFIM